MTDSKTHSRQGEKQNPENRIERTFNINNLWYFEVRGGGQKGPFDSQQQMEDALNEFIRLQQECCSADKTP